MLVNGIAQRVFLHEGLSTLPIVIVGAAKKNTDVEVDVDQVGRHQLAVHHDARGYIHAATPVRHLLICVIAHIGIIEGAPAAQQDASLTYLLIARQCLVKEVKEIIVQRKDLLHELDVFHEAD